MNSLHVTIRGMLRRMGLTGPLTQLLQWRHMQRYRYYRKEYERTRPTRKSVPVGPYTIDVQIRNVDEYCRFSATYETTVVEALLRSVKPGDVIWDIGANVGLYTLMLAKAVGPAGHVYAFEPAPDSAESIREHARMNGVQNFEVLQLALGRTAGTLRLTNPEPFSPVRRLLSDGQAAGEEGFDVSVGVGDDLRAQAGFACPRW